MAECNVASDEPEDDRDKVEQKVEVDTIWVDVEDCKAKSLFDKFVHVVWGEMGSDSGIMRPLPPRLGDGVCVDLFRVFLAVRERGGCKMVTECGMWNVIGESCGLGSGIGGPLKLVYMKYLDVLERWLDRIAECKKLKEDLGKLGDETGRMLTDLEDYLECMLKIITDEKEKNGKVSVLNLLMNTDSEALLIKQVKKSGVNEEEDVDTADFMMGTSEVMDEESGGNKNPDDSSLNLHAGSEAPGAQADSSGSKTDRAKEPDDEVNTMNDADDDVMIQSGTNKDGSTSLKKRKRQSFSVMLNWLTETAKKTCDPATSCLPEKSIWKSYGNEVLWKQVLAARRKLFIKPKVDSEADLEYFLTLEMSPAMYEEEHMFLRPRSSRKPASASKSPGIDGARDSPKTKDVDRKPSVGEQYQADLPEWGSSTSEKDMKWLGTRIWPLEKTEQRSSYESVPIGRGRQEGCDCSIAGSVECVRLHISEQSTRLKPELGSAFHYWRFDCMGENAAAAGNWSAEEQNKFKAVVMEYRHTKEIWNNLIKTFPARSISDIVNYYYNVFLLRHRAIQNRQTPLHIDSDIEVSSGSKAVGRKKSRPSIYNTPKKQKKKHT